ncbi:hypothetical protein F511_36450 [Dorcoceras hygrometricum]|uniref:Uncharacterized protein n=1 Tax=Dorcoceras hygrometricum TaxID=472368 RepID=A0A2Z7D5R1_9LAMI|nr:hypothetical protein F511_36450 [Dorcoceras hygrometricum]
MSLLFRGNVKTLSCRQLLRWENIFHRGNKGSDLLSMTSVEHERSDHQHISPTFCSGTFALSRSTEMASSFITYALQVDFESVLKISDHEGMLNMFKDLEASGLRGFLGCPSVFYEKELEEFFDIALVQDGDITGVVSSKFFTISETRFVVDVKFPTEGLVDLSEMPKNLVYDSRSIFSKSAVENVENVGKPITIDVTVGEIVVEPTEEERHASTQLETTDDVDVIIEKVIVETSQLATDEGDQFFDETNVGEIVFGDTPVDKAHDLEQWFDRSYEDFVSRDTEQLIVSTSDLDKGTGTAETVAGEQQVPMFVEKDNVAESEGSKDVVVAMVFEKYVGSNQIDEELMTLYDLLMQISDDMMLPSVTAAEITKIKSDLPVEIKEVHDQNWYYSSLPKISATEKGKAPLEEADTVKGNPAREMVQLICADVDFLIQMRQQVMHDVVEFFHYFSINKISDLELLRELAEKEKHMLLWAETDSLETAVKRRVYILAKYREVLLSKFLDSHRKYFTPGQSWTTMASQIIDLLSAAHDKSLDELQAQQQEHGIIMDRPRSSQSFDDSAASSGAVLAQFYYLAKSTCWVRPMVLVDGILTPLQGNDYWRSSCRDIVVHSSAVDVLEKIPNNFCSVFQQGIDSNSFVGYFSDSGVQPVLHSVPDIELLSLDGSTIYRSPSSHSDTIFDQGDLMDFHANSDSDEQTSDHQFDLLVRTTNVGSTPAVAQFSLPATDIKESFAQLRASIEDIQFEQIRCKDDTDRLRDVLLMHIRDLEKKFTERFDQQDRAYRTLLTNSRKDSQDLRDVLSLDLSTSHKKLSTQVAAVALDNVDGRKEVKELNAKVTYLDGQVSAIRNDLLNFHAKAEENHLNLSTQLGFLIDYINRGGDAKKGGKVVAASLVRLLMIKSRLSGDVCMAIESLTTLDLPMVDDSIEIYELKGPYYKLTMTDWFLQALSVIHRGSWGDVARRFTMIRWVLEEHCDVLSMQMDSDLVIYRLPSFGLSKWLPFVEWISPRSWLYGLALTTQNVIETLHDRLHTLPSPLHLPLGRRPPYAPPLAAACRRRRTCSDRRDEEIPSVKYSPRFLVQTDKGIVISVVDRIRRTTTSYR